MQPSGTTLRARLAGQKWRLLEDGDAPGAWNMAVDEALLEAARRDQAPPTLRLYGWSRPTLSLGRHQNPDAGIDHEFRRRRGIEQVRRPTGGRAVLHDREVTYAIALPRALARGTGVGDVYQVLTTALLAGLAELVRCSGVQVFRCSGESTRPPERLNTRTPEHLIRASCFATAAGGDALAGRGKLVGSAQARRAGAVLQHGSVLLQVRREDWLGLFGQPGLEVALDDLLGAVPSVAIVRGALRRGLEAGLGAVLTPGPLRPVECGEAERLVAQQHAVGCLD